MAVDPQAGRHLDLAGQTIAGRMGFERDRLLEVVGNGTRQGSAGGGGQPFNLGEATVTRASVRMETGEVGFSYLLGRDHDKARLAAVCDALWQSDSRRAAIERHVLAPIRERLERERAAKREQAAATRVDFFTLVRGED